MGWGEPHEPTPEVRIKQLEEENQQLRQKMQLMQSDLDFLNGFKSYIDEWSERQRA